MCKKLPVLTKSFQFRTDGPALVSNIDHLLANFPWRYLNLMGTIVDLLSMGFVAFSLDQFHKKCSKYEFIKWKIHL